MQECEGQVIVLITRCCIVVTGEVYVECLLVCDILPKGVIKVGLSYKGKPWCEHIKVTSDRNSLLCSRKVRRSTKCEG